MSDTPNPTTRSLEKERERLDLSSVYPNLKQCTEEDFKQGNSDSLVNRDA